MSFYGRTANEHVDLHLALLVEGVPFAFVERTIPGSPAALSGRTQLVCLTRVSEGEARLDYEQRRETAATMDVIIEDDEDHALRTLFAAGKRAVGWITDNYSATWADATDVSSTASIDDPALSPTGLAHFYVGAETITIDAINSATQVSVVTRGAFGSKARALHGDSSDGDAIYTTPPYWHGRRAWLYGYAPDATGLHTQTLLGVYTVDEAPAHRADGEWTMRFATIAQEFFNAVVGMGIRSTKMRAGTASVNTAADPWEHDVQVEDFRALQTGLVDTYAIVRSERGTTIAELIDVDDGTAAITLNYSETSFQTARTLSVVSEGYEVSPLAVVGGGSAVGLLQVLISDEGQGASTYDVLPGRPAVTSTDYGWRFGAALAPGDVDLDGFLAVSSVPDMAIIIDEERKLIDVLREWCWLTGTAVVIDANGRLSPVTLSHPRITGARNLTDDDLYPDADVSVLHDEASVFPILSVKAGYSPVTREFHDELNLVDVELAKRYQRAPQTREIELRSIDPWVHPNLGSARASSGWRHPARMSIPAVVSMLSEAMRGDGALARRFVRLALSHEHMDLRLGDLVTLSASMPDHVTEAPDMRGGTLSGVTCRIVSRRPLYDEARVDVTVEILDRLLHICPAARVKVVSGSQVQLNGSGPELESASPTDAFFVGAGVKIIDRSQGGGAGAPYFTVVDSIDGPDTMTLGGVPDAIGDGWSIQDNVDVLVLDPESSIAAGPSASGYQLVEAAMLAGDDGVAGTNPDATTEPRWR